MGSTGGSSGKTTSIKCAIAQVPVEAVCVIPKTEPFYLAIHIPHNSL